MKENLTKAINHGERLANLDGKKMPIDENRYKWVNKYHKENKPGFEDEGMIDVIKQLTYN
ncbi:MAG: hypothetical protein H0U73_13825 [Tatlockia sp.]|nr:hypothetical protein [Tatlockia sp.]